MKKLLSVAFLTCAFAASANTWYVDPVNGNDAYDGTTSNVVSDTTGPRRTLEKAMELVKTGDTLLLLPGEYKDGCFAGERPNGMSGRYRLFVDKGQVTVKSVAGPDKTFIVGAGESNASEDAMACIGTAAYDVVIDGVTITGGRTSGTGGGMKVRWSSDRTWAIGCVFTNCCSTGVGGGLYGGSAARCVFVDCASESGNGGNAVGVGVDLEYCLFLRGQDSTRGMRQIRNSARFYNCTFYGAIGGVFENYSYSTYLYNCVSVGNKRWGTDVDNGVTSAGSLYLKNSVLGACPAAAWASVLEVTDSQTNVSEKVAGLFAPFAGDCRAVAGGMLDGAGDGRHLMNSPLPAGYEHRDLAGVLVPTNGPVTIGCLQETVATTGARYDFPCDMEVKGIDRPFAQDEYLHPTNAPWTYKLRPVSSNGKVVYGLYASGESEDSSSITFRFPMGDSEQWIPFPATRPAGQVLSLSVIWASGQRYVDAENGNDTWDGSSPTRGEGSVGPWRTLAHAGTNAVAYTIVNVAPGVYSNGVVTGVVDSGRSYPIPRRAWLKESIGLRATEGPERTFIVGAPDPDGAGASISGLGPNAVAGVITFANYPFVQGFTVTGCYMPDTNGDYDRGAAFYGGNRRFQVLDCVISNNFAYNTAVMNGGHLLRCRVFNNRAIAYQLRNVRAYDCIFRGNIQNGTENANYNSTAYNTAYYFCTIDCGGRCRPVAQSDQYAPASHLCGCVVVNAFRAPGETNWVDTVYDQECDPALADVANGDYRLGVLSPALGRIDWATLPSGLDSFNGKWFTSVALDGRDVLVAGNGRIAAGAVQETPLPCIAISGIGREMVTGGKLGTNVVTSASAKITVTASSKRPLVGYAVNGVTNEQAGASYEIPAPSGSSATVVEAVYGTEWYVDAVNGNDANGGGTLAGAKKRIRAATENAESGDVVRVAPGTYGEQEGVQHYSSYIVGTRVLIPEKVSLESIEGPESTIIVGAPDTVAPDVPLSDLVSVGYGSNAVRCVTAKSGASIRGFTLTGGYTSSDKNMYDREKRGSAFYPITRGAATIENCIVSNNYAFGGTIYGSVVRKCRIFGNETVQLEDGKPAGAGSGALDSWVYDSIADRNRGQSTFRICTVVDNCTIGRENVSLEGALNPQVFFTTVNGCSMTGTALLYGRISAYTASGATPVVIAVTNCLIRNGSCNTNSVPESLRCHCLFSNDSQLQVDADYRPVRGSFAGLDMNEPTAAELVGTDIRGTQRVMNARTDAGAVEYDWRGDYGTLLGRDVTVTEASPLVEVLEGTRQLKIPASCSVVATVADPGERRVDVAVSGGTLTVKAGETTIGTYTADARVILTPNGEPLTFAFAADSGVADAYASIGRIGRTGGVIMIVR